MFCYQSDDRIKRIHRNVTDHRLETDSICQLLFFMYNYTSIVVEDKQSYTEYSLVRHLHPVRGILCTLSVASAKRDPLFDARSFHEQTDRKLSLRIVCACTRTYCYSLIE